MMRPLVIAGALLFAALPAFTGSAPEIQRFNMDETPDQIVKIMGRPTHIDDSLKSYQSWQYDAPPDEESDDNSPPAWFFCWNSADRRLLSITRNFDKPRDIDALFP